MVSKIKQMFGSLYYMDHYDRLKLLLLSTTFFLVIGAYTLVRELKSSIFVSICGKEHVPILRIAVLFGLIPAILFYSFLVSKLRRYQLLYVYCLFYGIAALVCIYLVGHPTIGLPNTEASPYRIFGWLFYFLIEGFSPFVVSVFWAFANSVYNPEEAKDNYALIVTGSKFGGMLTAGSSWFLFSYYSGSEGRVLSDVATHQLLLAAFAFLTLLVPVVLYYLVKKVPGRYLHGYEAVYQFEKKKEKEERKVHGLIKWVQSMFSGITMLVKYPYVLGIFGMLFFYEVVSTVLSYHRICVAHDAGGDICGMSLFLFRGAFIQHLFGLFISYLGTRTLLHRFGERVCLLLIPAITFVVVLYFTLSYTDFAVQLALIALQALNYAFAQPVRESLYIPCVKDMKFKSKSWIDAFGSRFAKSVGSGFNKVAISYGPSFFFVMHSMFFSVIVLLWFATAYILGKRYERAIKNNEVIGLEAEAAEA